MNLAWASFLATKAELKALDPAVDLAGAAGWLMGTDMFKHTYLSSCELWNAKECLECMTFNEMHNGRHHRTLVYVFQATVLFMSVSGAFHSCGFPFFSVEVGKLFPCMIIFSRGRGTRP